MNFQLFLLTTLLSSFHHVTPTCPTHLILTIKTLPVVHIKEFFRTLMVRESSSVLHYFHTLMIFLLLGRVVDPLLTSRRAIRNLSQHHISSSRFPPEAINRFRRPSVGTRNREGTYILLSTDSCFLITLRLHQYSQFLKSRLELFSWPSKSWSWITRWLLRIGSVTSSTTSQLITPEPRSAQFTDCKTCPSSSTNLWSHSTCRAVLDHVWSSCTAGSAWWSASVFSSKALWGKLKISSLWT